MLVDHPKVTRVFQLLQNEETVDIVMEYVVYGSMSQWMQTKF